MAISTHEIGLLRLVAQRIAGPAPESALDAVHHLGAVQAQDPAGVIMSIALRTRSRRRADVVADFGAGRIVTSWPMRGTLHTVAAADLPWLLALTAPRVIAAQTSRRHELGLRDADLERALELAVAAMSGGRELTRAQLLRCWSEAGLDTSNQRGYHLIVHLAQSGAICLGPIRDDGQRFVLLPEWVPEPRVLDREEALGELAYRYFAGHGPATVKDFGRWGKLVAPDVRTGVALARPALAELDIGGDIGLMHPQTPELLARHRRSAQGVFLLPGFDEYMLGYGDRSATLPARFADRIVPGGNGIFRPTVVRAGQVVATWRRGGRDMSLEIDAFAPLPAGVVAAAQKACARLP